MCRRRNPSREEILGVGKFLKPKYESPAQVRRDNKEQSCRDRMDDSTDDADLAALSSDGSDRETTSSQTPSGVSQPTSSSLSSTSARYVPPPQRNVPAGFSIPPGLQAPKCWNARPKPVNQTLGHLQGNPPATMEAIKQEILNDVMGKLSSEDADLLKTLFNARQPAVAPTTDEALSRSGFHDPWQRRSLVQPSRNVRCHQASVPIGVENSLRSNLRRMATIDENRIIFVKKISKLGLNSSHILKKYFSRFGVVEEVVCTHAVDKRDHNRSRPANTGFVIFGKAEDAAAAIRCGSEQVVSGVSVSIRTYEHQLPKEARGNNGGEQQACGSERW